MTDIGARPATSRRATSTSTVSIEGGWLLILRDLGIHPENVLRRAELPVDLLARGGVRVGIAEYFELWRALQRESNDPLLPIHIGKILSPEAFHPPIFAAMCSPDLTVAVRRIAEYKRLVAPVTVVVEERGGGLFVGMRWDVPDDPAVRMPEPLVASELVFLTQIARIATREPIRPLRVVCPFALEPAAAYTEYFGVAPERAEVHGVTFSLEDARRPFLTASESMWQTFKPELRRRLTKLESSAPLSERVRSVLLESLPSGEASIEVTARRLGVSARTLQRKLRPEGTSYKEIVRSTREQLARHYLTETSLGHAEISFLLGFEEPSSFFRAFRAWTGTTPESVRTETNGDPAG